MQWQFLHYVSPLYIPCRVGGGLSEILHGPERKLNQALIDALLQMNVPLSYQCAAPIICSANYYFVYFAIGAL